MIIRKFDRAKSVWKDWKVDDAKIIENCLKHDFTFWKIPRFVKDEQEIKNIQKVVTKYFPILKAEHILMACDSIFPASDRDIFTGFSRKAKFHDKNVS